MSILNTTVAEADARLDRVWIDPSTGDFKIKRFWPKIDAQQTQALIATLTAAVTNPKADGVTYTGSFSVVDVYADGEQERDITIVQILKQDGYADLVYCYGKNYFDQVCVTQQYDISETQVLSLVSGYAYANYDATHKGHNYNISVSRNSDDKTYNVQIVDTTVAAKTVEQWISRKAFNSTVKTTRYKNAALDKPPDAARTGDGHVQTVQGDVTDEGRINYDVIDENKDKTAAAIEYDSADDAQSKSHNIIDLNIPAEDAVLTLTATAGQRKTLRVRGYDPEMNTLDTDTETETLKTQSAISTEDNALMRRVVTAGSNTDTIGETDAERTRAAAAADAAADDANTVVRLDQRYTVFGKYEKIKEVQKPRAYRIKKNYNTSNGIATLVWAVNQTEVQYDADLALITSSDRVYLNSVDKNRFGLFDYQLGWAPANGGGVSLVSGIRQYKYTKTLYRTIKDALGVKRDQKRVMEYTWQKRRLVSLDDVDDFIGAITSKQKPWYRQVGPSWWEAHRCSAVDEGAWNNE